MGYRRRGRSKRDYGLERAQRHIAEAHAFSAEVGHTDDDVKEAFFSLDAASLDNIFAEYGALHGTHAEQWARATYHKWRNHWRRRRHGGHHRWQPDEVQMGGMVAERLFALLPPLLPTAQKHKIVEGIWKAYGPRSQKYIYLGPDSDPETVESAIEAYLANQSVLYAIPEELEARFDWLSSNDVTVKQQLLNHFMNEQRKAAIASVRLNIPMMLDRMNTDTEGRISKLIHTVYVGNHQLEVKADPLRTGFTLSDSPNDAIKPPPKFSWPAGLGIAAAILIGFFIVNSTVHSNVSAPPQQVADTTRSQPAAPLLSQPLILETQPAVVPPPARTSSPAVAHRQPGAPPQTSPPSQPNHGMTAVAPGIVNGCQGLQIASVNGDGSQIIVSNGNRYSVSDDVMRITASNWATGDPVGVCSSSVGASLKVGYSSVQAFAVGTTSVDMGNCRNLYIGYTTADGSKVGATDGSIFHLVPNDVLKMTASNWTTGEPATVCTALHDGVWYAALRVGYSKVQATLASIGTGRAQEATCSDATVEIAANESGRLRVGNSAYQIENDVMQMTAQQFVTGDAVVVCKYSTRGTTYASIAKGFSRVQATQI